MVYSTLLFAPLTDDDTFQTALTVSYNKWIAERCAEAPNRLKWAAVLPLCEPKAAVREIHRVKDAGAVSLMCFGTVGERHAPHAGVRPRLGGRPGGGFAGRGPCRLAVGLDAPDVR